MTRKVVSIESRFMAPGTSAVLPNVMAAQLRAALTVTERSAQVSMLDSTTAQLREAAGRQLQQLVSDTIELDPGSQIETHDLCGLRTLLPELTAGTNVARHSSARNGREAESCKELGRAIGEQVELA